MSYLLNFIYYIMITLLSNIVKKGMREILTFKELNFFTSKSVYVLFSRSRCAMHRTCATRRSPLP